MKSRFTGILTLFLAFMIQFSFAQEKTITGTVTSADDGLPLPGASVMVEGTTKGTQTDLDGKYSITANQGENLVFSFLGMANQVITVGTSNVVDVLLAPETEMIDPIVVVAYGQQTKSSITGSIKEVKAEEIQKVTTGNVLQGLVGKVAGVQVVNNNGMPGDAPVIRFRGIGSINASSSPLYVVDGIPFNGDIASINNNDIESMTFLKDASAAALYGNRGANGVIIVTTKKGLQQKSAITIDTRSGFSSRAVKDYDKITDPAKYYEGYFNILKNGYMFGPTGLSNSAAAVEASNNLITGPQGLGYNIYNVPNDQLIDPVTGTINPNAQILFQEDWEDFLFGSGLFTQTNISVRGGDKNTQHFFSVGYDKNEGYVVNSGLEKMSGRLNIDSKISETFQIGGVMSYTHLEQNYLDGYTGGTSYSGPFRWTRYTAPIYPVHVYDQNTGEQLFNSVGNPIYDDGQGLYNGGVVRPAGAGPLQNPYATAMMDIKRWRTDNLFSSANASVNLLDGLKFKYTVTGELFNQHDTSMDTPLIGDAVGVNGRIQIQSTRMIAFTNQQLLTYNKSFGAHNINVLLGHETLDRRSDFVSAHRTNMLLPDTDILNHAGVLRDNGAGGSNYALEGYFSRFGYDYGNKYYINANVRRDGSSRFHPDNRWGTFYGLGAAWRVSQEDFMSNVSWVNELKLKASYGEQGNDNLGLALPYLDLYSVEMTTDAEAPLIVNQAFKGNKDITWETNVNFNAGFEASLFDGRLNVEAEYFKREVKDMLFMKPLPLSSGFSQLPENVGDMENIGYEVAVDGDVIRNKDLRVNLYANFTKFENKITKLPESPLDDNAIISGSRILREGGTYYDYYMREFAGVNPANGAALFWKDIEDADGNVTGRELTENWSDGTRYIIDKRAYADIYGGFGVGVEYKGIDFAAHFAYQLGGWGYDSGYFGYFGGEAGSGLHNDIVNTWTPENTTANLPRVEVNDPNLYYSTSTMGLIKSDYLSLQTLSLGYTFSKEISRSVGLEELRFYALADNVALWSKRQGYDPRLSLTGGTDNKYSLIRTVSFGVKVQF
ncbi:MAG: SusC/RagA family TonB-linked outer membrane protein [Flavobacteriaceae bacterium]